MKEIGRVMGISESRVCQIHTKTLNKLKAHTEELAEQTEEGARPPRSSPPHSPGGARCFE